MVGGVVLRVVAQHLAGAVDRVVLPVVVGDPVDDLEAVLGVETSLEEVGAVAVGEPHRLAAFVVLRRVGFGEVADPNADDPHLGFVVVVPTEGLASDLAHAVEVAGSREFGAVEPELVGWTVEFGHSVLGFVAPDGVVGGGEDEPLDPGLDGGFEDGPGPVDVVGEHAVPRRFGARVAREVDHRVDADHRLGHRLLVGDIRHHELVVELAGRSVPVEASPVVGVAELAEDRAADPSGRAGKQYARLPYPLPHSSGLRIGGDKKRAVRVPSQASRANASVPLMFSM